MARIGQRLNDPVAEGDRRRHQLRGLIAGKAENQALIARALFLVFARINALRDLGRLFVDVAVNRGFLPVKAFLLIADLFDDPACGLDYLIC